MRGLKKKILICLTIVLLFITGCSSEEAKLLQVIEETENSYMQGGKFADKHRESVFNALKESDFSEIELFCSEEALEVLKAMDLGDFVRVKSCYLTSIGKRGINDFSVLRVYDKLYTLCLYWSEAELYAVEWGEIYA